MTLALGAGTRVGGFGGVSGLGGQGGKSRAVKYCIEKNFNFFMS